MSSTEMVNFERFDQTNLEHIKSAEQIAEWSKKSASMIPLTVEAISQHPFGVLAFSVDNGQLAGYAGLTVQYSEQLLEFGGLVTNPELRRKGIGQSLTQQILSQTAAVKPNTKQVIAFGNTQSGKLFEKLTCSTLTMLGRCSLTKDVWKLCKTCPTKPKNFTVEDPDCCDRVYDLTKLTGVESND